MYSSGSGAAHSLLQFPSPVTTARLIDGISHSPVTGAITVIGGREIVNNYDPQGAREKRGLVHRYVTVTLPDNAPLSLLYFVGRTDFSEGPILPTIAAISFLTLGASQIIEMGRWSIAWVLDKLDNPFSENATKFIGPRDFYARKMSDEDS